MRGQNGASNSSEAALKSKGKGKAKLQDDSIMGTNNSSIVSKRSVERLYYPDEAHWFRYFVKKPQRRSPLINRGYWLRMKAIDHVVKEFLEQDSKKQKIVINLGCGYDPLPWQCLSRYPSHCNDVKFVDIDYKELMIKKRDMIKGTPELVSLLTNIELLGEGNVLLRSDQYLQLGCDLRDIESLSQTLKSTIDVENSLVLLTAEVSITYMNVEAADTLIKWAGSLPEARFCLLEQLLPNGAGHPFAQTMMAHFNKLQTPLRAVQNYPTTLAQEKRFQTLGWSKVLARNLWELWSDSDFLRPAERISLDIVEPFDEWEEFALFGCHYFLLVADNMRALTDLDTKKDTPLQEKVKDTCQDATYPLEIEISYSENPKTKGCRRFAAPLPLASKGVIGTVGNFAGMGLHTRINTYDVYANEKSNNSPRSSAPIGPSSRMCHTITDLGDAGALLVGGRTSPDNALIDCWLYHKWLNIWERVDDLPLPRYRHGAVSLVTNHVLISAGKTNSQHIDTDFYVWSRILGWAKCRQDPGEQPVAVYGATFTVFENSTGLSGSTCGLLAGGMSDDGVLQQDIWEWELRNFTSKEPVIVFRRFKETFDCSPIHQMAMARFGAAAVKHRGYTWIIGGIVKNEILKISTEIVCLDTQSRVPRAVLPMFPGSDPWPLLIGSSVVSTGGSLLIMGGSAVCFSFGTFWNNGCYELHVLNSVGQCGVQSQTQSPSGVWRFLHSANATSPSRIPHGVSNPEPINTMTSIPRVRIGSSPDFFQILRSAKPVILEGLNLGSCTELWTTGYLKDQVGAEREVVVHEATAEHMDFTSKNFSYSTKKFGDFIDQVDKGGRLYLRSLSSEKPAELPADIDRDFPSIAKDFRLPPELSLIIETAHSSPLRISGRVIMWLHYDVMANVLCQIRGSKRLLLFPPSDVQHFEFEPGASSSSINVFNKPQTPSLSHTHPHEALLQPGDVLFLPPLWLHTASPTSGISIAVNVFFRNLQTGYAAGKDVYGNRDLQAYEKGRQDIAKIVKSFDSLPNDVRGFYLQRLVKELEQKTC